MELQFPGNVYGTDGCRGGQSRCRGFLPFSSPLCHAVAINPDTQSEAEPFFRGINPSGAGLFGVSVEGIRPIISATHL